jgi:hypothetical protein
MKQLTRVRWGRGGSQARVRRRARRADPALAFELAVIAEHNRPG